MGSHTIRVLVVDEHAMVRRGLAAFLRTDPDLQMAGEAANGKEAIAMCEQLQPDVILMDLLMPEMDGTTATRIIRERWPHVQIIALTSFGDRELVQGVLRAGAISYLLKNVSAGDLADAIRGAYAGRSTLAPEAMQVLVCTAEPDAATRYALTPREREVLVLMVAGLNNPQIAERLTVSRATAKAHVSNVLSKLGVSNRAEAITLALKEKLV